LSTVCNIQNSDQLSEAVRIAKIISREFVVEEFIKGEVHRITLVGGEVVAVCLRKPPNVIGDGIHTVRELIEIKNLNPMREAMGQKNFTLHKIPISARTLALLTEQNLNLDSIIPKGKKVYLHDKVILACGADIHDTTDQVRSENRALFQKVYALCQLPIIGLDFITEDISKPYYEQKCAIIEVNSLPYIDMHHYPVTGKARNVAARILDYYLFV
jgi:cyanophycin synthetase